MSVGVCLTLATPAYTYRPVSGDAAADSIFAAANLWELVVDNWTEGNPVPTPRYHKPNRQRTRDDYNSQYFYLTSPATYLYSPV
jgi:hypothetical protein